MRERGNFIDNVLTITILYYFLFVVYLMLLEMQRIQLEIQRITVVIFKKFVKITYLVSINLLIA